MAQYLLIDLNNPQYRKFDSTADLVANLLNKDITTMVVIEIDPVTNNHTVIDVTSSKYSELYSQFDLPIVGNLNVSVECE